jgi:hypothetical protein
LRPSTVEKRAAHVAFRVLDTVTRHHRRLKLGNRPALTLFRPERQEVPQAMAGRQEDKIAIATGRILASARRPMAHDLS